MTNELTKIEEAVDFEAKQNEAYELQDELHEKALIRYAEKTDFNPTDWLTPEEIEQWESATKIIEGE